MDKARQRCMLLVGFYFGVDEMRKNKGDAVIGVMVMAFFALMAVGYLLDWYSCSNYGKMSGMQTDFQAFGGGCYVKTKKGWFLREQLRDVDVER